MYEPQAAMPHPFYKNPPKYSAHNFLFFLFSTVDMAAYCFYNEKKLLSRDSFMFGFTFYAYSYYFTIFGSKGNL